MFYDNERIGGDHCIRTKDGDYVMFLVMRIDGLNVLLAKHCIWTMKEHTKFRSVRMISVIFFLLTSIVCYI